MPYVAVPPAKPPRVALYDGHDFSFRVFKRLHLWTLTAITVVLTGWLCTFGVVPAILALVVAKHVLVAILVMGLGVDSTQAAEA
jgi:hypothetical protein